MKSVVLVIAEKNFRDEEYQVPKEIFEEAGMKVITASTTLKQVVGKLGLKVTPDALLEDIKVDQIDGLFFIGGGGAEQYFNDLQALGLAIEAEKKGKIYGAICIAPAILANAGLLKNKKATSYSSEVGLLKEKGAIYTNEGVVVDGRLVTADGPQSAKKFGEAIARLI